MARTARKPRKGDLDQHITIDLDAFDLSKEQGFGSGVHIARIDILRGGKRQTVHIDIFQHELKRDPTIRMTAVGPSRDVTQAIQVKPWTVDE